MLAQKGEANEVVDVLKQRTWYLCYVGNVIILLLPLL